MTLSGIAAFGIFLMGTQIICTLAVSMYTTKKVNSYVPGFLLAGSGLSWWLGAKHLTETAKGVMLSAAMVMALIGLMSAEKNKSVGQKNLGSD